MDYYKEMDMVEKLSEELGEKEDIIIDQESQIEILKEQAIVDKASIHASRVLFQILIKDGCMLDICNGLNMIEEGIPDFHNRMWALDKMMELYEPSMEYEIMSTINLMELFKKVYRGKEWRKDVGPERWDQTALHCILEDKQDWVDYIDHLGMYWAEMINWKLPTGDKIYIVSWDLDPDTGLTSEQCL